MRQPNFDRSLTRKFKVKFFIISNKEFYESFLYEESKGSRSMGESIPLVNFLLRLTT